MHSPRHRHRPVLDLSVDELVQQALSRPTEGACRFDAHERTGAAGAYFEESFKRDRDVQVDPSDLVQVRREATHVIDCVNDWLHIETTELVPALEAGDYVKDLDEPRWFVDHSMDELREIAIATLHAAFLPA